MPYIGNNNLPFDPTRTAAAPRDADRFSGNGSTVTFTLSRAVQKAVDIEVFVENVQQEPVFAYDVNGTSLTFTGAPPSGTNNVYVVYRNFDSGAQVYVPDGSITYSKLANNIRIFTTDNLTPNGNNSVFTLSEPPADANTVMVTVDGVMQRAPVHYTTSGSTITFTSAPPAGANVHVRHLGFRTTTTVTQLAANSTITTPNITTPTITGGTFNSVAQIGVGVAANTSYGIFNRYFGNSEIATQYGTGNITGVGAYATNGGVFIDNGTSKVYPMLWDTTGRVTKPYQPAFYATGTNSTYTVSSDTVIEVPMNVAHTNIGSHFNTSTYRFTAPIAGIYLFSISATPQSSGTGVPFYLLKNGTAFFGSSSYTEAFSYNSSGGYHTTTSRTVVISLSVNDYVSVGANRYNSSSQGFDLPRCSIMGYFLG